ncbi:MAG: peptidoglycan D,D-transpeptidase FtsI family protein [Planctomycetota bacterium]
MTLINSTPGHRARLLFALLLLGLSGLIGRAGYLQLVRGDHFRLRARQQHFHQVEVPPMRGRILDRQGRALVSCYHSRSLAVDAVAAEAAAKQIARRENREVGRWTTEWAARFSLALGMPERTAEVATRLRAAVQNKQRFRYLARRLDRDIADRVEATSLPGLVVLEEPRREYPHGHLAAAVIGMVGPDAEGRAHGLSGLERACDDRLRGHAGVSAVQRSGRHEMLHLYPELDQKPRPGRDLITTLDLVVQRIVEEELAALEETFSPEVACAVAMDPRTGDILALAGRPDLDPSEFPRVGKEALRIPAIHLSYEPGSTMKPLIVAGALSHGAVRPNQMFDCGPGYRRFGWRRVHDVRPRGDLDLAGVLIKSSNIGMAQVGLALGVRRTWNHLDRLGFGNETGVRLPGEEQGTLTHVSKWREHEHLISVSFGRAIVVTPLQLATAFSSLVNGGLLVQPRLLAPKRGPQTPAARRVGYAPDALAFVRETLVRVVSEGTGRRARVPGVAVGGKTGTSELYPKGSKRYDSSFVAFAPADDPRLVVLVVARDPKKSKTCPRPYGGVVAAPTVGRILRRTLPVLEARMNGAPSESGVRQTVQKDNQVRVAAVQRSSARVGERISPANGRNPDSVGAVLCRSDR